MQHQDLSDLLLIHGMVPGALGRLDQCTLIYMDNNQCVLLSPLLEQHLLEVTEVLKIFCLQLLHVKR